MIEEARPKEMQYHQQMSEWYQSMLGRKLLDVESSLLENMLSRRFGYHLLELGCANLNMFQSSPIGHKFSFAPANGDHSHGAYASPEAIPLASESIDLVLLHHALDFSANQHQLLREACRILIAGGHIIIIGFNPLSTWGLRNRLHWKNAVPWRSDMLGTMRLTDWLKLLDFQIEKIQYGAYFLPFNSPGLIRYSSALESIATRLNWPTGCIYIISARKQVLPLTPIQSSWKKFPAAVGIPAAENISGVSQRQGKDGRSRLCDKQ
ncbi:MAG: methyltransferase domain-containing protein [Pseudohongiellaceae bacterium]